MELEAGCKSIQKTYFKLTAQDIDSTTSGGDVLYVHKFM